MIINKNLCEILILLDNWSEASVCAMAKELGTSQPLISKRLKELREAELVCFRKEGNTVFYFINEEKYSLAIQIINVYFELIL